MGVSFICFFSYLSMRGDNNEMWMRDGEREERKKERRKRGRERETMVDACS